jgi:coproporphyrinogen III oxidase-like Fe-S oxidoreductase
MLPMLRHATRLPGQSRGLDGKLVNRANEELEPAWIGLDSKRPLIVGIIPHTQCNPSVAGCGFCTFPHDRHDKRSLIESVLWTGVDAIDSFDAFPGLQRRRVDAVYFGGATANLTPYDALTELAESLADLFDWSHAEVTLEGVPSLFRSMLRSPFDTLLSMPARHRRISMGVQTFDPSWIARMGRQAFGDRKTVTAVVEKAQKHGVTTSADFLINLPGQPVQAMLDDVRQAAACGLDQICIYHLVLNESTGAEWSKDPALMAALPNSTVSRDQWLAVREWLVGNGFVQTTLTNFERADVHTTDRRFVYEEHSFSPDTYDALGIGPTAISTFVDGAARRAIKFVRGKGGRRDNLFFTYEEEDLRLLHVTRTLAKMTIDRATYAKSFGADLAEHFGDALDAIVEAKLATLDERALRLTPEGMFYADSIAGLFAWPRVRALAESGAGRHTRDLLEGSAVPSFMG